MSIAEKIKSLRVELGLSVYELADRSGVSAQSIYRYENGEVEKLTLANVEKLASALHCDPADLIGWSRILAAVTVPVFERPQAPFSISGQAPIGYSTVEEKLAAGGECFGLRIPDDGMSPFMLPGDVAIIRRQQDVESGQIGCVEIDGLVTLRRLRLALGGVTLLPLGEGLPSQSFSWSDAAGVGFSVVGRCIQVKRTV